MVWKLKLLRVGESVSLVNSNDTMEGVEREVNSC